MEEEIKAAAKWWADCLRETSNHDNGIGLQSALGQQISAQKAPLKEIQIVSFQNDLENRLRVCYNADDWRPDAPMWAAGHRALFVDYDPIPLLCDAANAVGIDLTWRLPIKTMMWVNPGWVGVQRGYRAEIVTVFGTR